MLHKFDLIVAGGRVVTPNGVVDADIGITDGRIAQIASDLDRSGDCQIVEAADTEVSLDRIA